MKILSRLVSILVYVFLYAPLAVMIFFSFNAGKSTSVFSGFSLRWYVELFTNDRTIIECLVNSLKLAVASSLIATVIGTVAAIGIYKLKNKYLSGAILTVNNIPMMNPDIVTGVSMMLLFVFTGALLGLSEKVNFTTLLIAHITFNIPYVVLNVLPKLKQSDVRLYEAAQDLGCTPVKAFFKAVMPQISGGIAAGLLMAFTLSFDDFVISYYTSGTDYVTLPVYIYSLVKKTVTPDIYALYSIILVAILALLVVYNAILSRADTKKGN
ncbi:MAG: ABC transporter permease [Clostridia bacterium]|nr:ABC transporter permease [Clostridia bacterium]